MNRINTQILLVAAALLCGTNPAAAQRVLFSLDIGSDTEISDPVSSAANEQLDPGDVFVSSGVAGSTGAPALDDLTIFGADPAPVQGVAASAAPVGNGNADYRDYFDLDGYDRLPISLGALEIHGEILDSPRLRSNIGPLDCMYEAEDLLLSFHDDDDTVGWRAAAAPRVPTEGPATYGTNANDDELVLLSVSGGSFSPGRNERRVHVDLTPTPDALEDHDDDVDALDYARRQACSYEYFSADDEGRLGLLPGTIYQVAPGMAPIVRITEAMIGVAVGTDVDAFEFAWVKTPQGPQANQFAFAVLFSVGADKPASVIDESGGLNPGSIYASFLTGTNFEFVNQAAYMLDNVDAIAALPPTTDNDGDLVPDLFDNCLAFPNPAQVDADQDGIGNQCDADYTNDCDTGFDDLVKMRLAFFSTDPVVDIAGPGDSLDGTVDFYDLTRLKQLFFQPPGPAAPPNLCDAD